MERERIANPDTPNALYHEYRTRLETLSNSLPVRFQENLRVVRDGLSLLFTSSYPWTLNDGDFSGMNVFVDPSTSHITGIIDWPEATVGPFGLSLWGVENFLSIMNATGWHYYCNSQALRARFWQTFEGNVGELVPDEMHGIRIARMLGLFLRWGFDWGRGGQEVVKEDDTSFWYLDAFCATVE